MLSDKSLRTLVVTHYCHIFLETFNLAESLPPNHFLGSHDFLQFFLLRDFKAASSYEKEKNGGKWINLY